MIVVPVKEGENIEKALKKFKRKFEKTGVVKELRNRQAFTKPSVVKRKQLMRAKTATNRRIKFFIFVVKSKSFPYIRCVEFKVTLLCG